MTDIVRLPDILKADIERLCVRHGDFTLASGAKSKIYFNMKPAMFDPQVSPLLFLQLGRLLPYSPTFEVLGGPEVGAIPLVVGVCAGYGIQGFYVRKQPKTHGVNTMIEGLPLEYNLKGKRAVLMEDVTTTGDSVMRCVDALEAEGAIVAAVVTILDRSNGAIMRKFQSRGITFKSLYELEDFDANA